VVDWMTWDDGALTADVVTSIGVEHRAEVTTHPIETGSEIADHVIVRSPSVTFEFAQSALASFSGTEVEWKQVPIDVRESQFQPSGLLLATMAAGKAIAAIGAALGLGGGNTIKVWALSAKEDKDRIHEMHDALVDVQKQRKLVAFSYKGLVLSDYVLTDVRYSRDAKAAGLCRFTIEAQHIETVATSTSALGGLGGALGGLVGALRALPLLDQGNKSVEKVEKEVIKKSLLASGLDSLGLGL
jgi:hypothetical protein